MKKIVFVIALSFITLGALTSCGTKSQANKEQIENAREQADDMLNGYDPSKPDKPLDQNAVAAPADAQGKVTFDTATTTEIIVSESN